MKRIQIKSDGTGPGTTVIVVGDGENPTLTPLHPESIAMDLAHDGGTVALAFHSSQVDLDLNSEVTDEAAASAIEASKLDDLGILITGVDCALTMGDMPAARDAFSALRKALRP